ncbi:hypothetical protein [Mastigocladopsis repens]|uniref:hypothetical protein n=1 Tax=Mastigocladopsis repens TaxID=221287 RepID=UPI00031B40D9|nr:hypothetical protein [Mastigocladopsis repens]
MNSIIRSNAIETSSQTENSGIHFHNLYPYCDLVSQKVFIYAGNVASTKEALPEASTDTHIVRITNSQIASKNTGYGFTFLQVLREQLPLTFAHLVTLRSMAFLTAVVVWAWTGKIEQVSHVRGKFVASGEPQKHQLQHFGKVINTAIEDAQKLKPRQVVAELDREILSSEVEVQKQHPAADQMQFNRIKDLMARTRMLALTAVEIRAHENQAGIGAFSKLEAYLTRGFSTSSKTVSIFPTAKPLQKLG